MSIDFRSDPLSGQFKGWKQRPNSPRINLQPGWEPRPEYGAGADEPIEEPFGWTLPGLSPPEPKPFDWTLPGSPLEAPPDVAPEAPPVVPDPDLTRRLGGTPPPDPDLQRRLGGTPLPDPDLQAHLGGVYPPPQARALSSPAPVPASAGPSPASPPVTAPPRSAPAVTGGPGSALPPSPPQPRSPTQKTFVDTLLPTAQAVARETGIPWQVLMAIPANETGWGASVFHNNLFGIKGPGASARTWEVINGKRVDTTDSFRTFNSPEDAMKGFAQFLYDNPRYHDALTELQQHPTEWPKFVNMLGAAGYATDPNWANQVVRIGQGLESADSMPHTDMSVVNAPRGQGGVINTARAALGTDAQAGGTNKKPGDYVFPVQGYDGKINTHWGEVTGGSDLFAPRGTPVMAMRGGKVIESGWNSVGGNAVLIQGDDGLQYYYAHGNEAPSVKVGDTVPAGTFLMPVGDTGDAKGKGTHLHIGIGPDIKLGADKYGGTGGDFDAVSLLRTAQTGGDAPPPTFTNDASFVAWTYRHGAGKNLPSTPSALYAVSKPIRADDAVPGDMVMFNMNSSNPDDQHVGIYSGGGKMLHNSLGSVVETELPGGGQFRRLAGVTPDDLTKPGLTGQTANVINPIVRYRDNGDGTYTATHRDGTTTLERRPSQLAPIEGGAHPTTVGAHQTTVRTPMGGGQEDEQGSAPTPIEDPLDPMSDPDARKQALRDQGWSEGAIDTVSNVPTRVWGTPPPPGPVWAAAYTPPTQTPPQSVGDALTSDPGHIDMYSAPISEARGQVTGTGEPATPQRIYEHEAHHAINQLTGGPAEHDKRYQTTYDNAADVLEDLNTVRQHAAQTADRDLFDAVNDTLWQYHNDPEHANLYVGMLSRQPQAPDWYRAKYFDYLKSTPEWTGTRASSPTQSALSPRIEGQQSYEDEQLAAQRQAQLKANWDRQMTPGDPDLREHLGSGQEAAPEPPLDTYYHGTTSEFGKVDPNAIAGMNLYGPGYYVTSSPTVAGGTVESGDPNDPEYNPTYAPGTVYKPGYAHKGMDIQRLFELQKRLEEDHNTLQHVQTMDPSTFSQWGTTRDAELATAQANMDHTNQQLRDLVSTQANVRQIGVPRDLSFWDLDQPMDDKASKVLSKITDDPPEEFIGAKGTEAYKDALDRLVTDKGWEAWEAQDTISAAMAQAGYDGIAHVGGARTGTPPHDVRVIFPENVGKVKNLISGEWGGSDIVNDTTPRGHTPGQDVVDPVGHQPGQDVVDPVGHQPGQDVVDPEGHVPTPPITDPVGHTPGDDVPTFDPKPKLPDIPLSPPKPSFSLPTMPGLPALPGVGAGAEAAAPSMSKKEASYTKKATEDNCRDCSMFRARKCSLVKGYINPGGSCDYYEPSKRMGAGAEGDYDPNDIDPLTGLPRGRPANQVIPEAIAGAPGAVGGFFNQLGTTAHDLLPTPEQQDKSWVEAPPPPAQQPLAPVQGPAAPSGEITPTSPVDLSGVSAPAPAAPSPPTAVPTLEPDNPIMQAARGDTVNPMEWNTAVGRAITQSAVPEDIRQASVDLPVVGKVTGEDVGAQVLSPGSLIGAATAGATELNNLLATEAPIIAPRIAAQVAAAVAGNLGQTPLDQAGGMIGGKVAGKVLGAASKAVPPVVENAVPFVKALAQSPLGKFLTEDKGSANANVAFAIGRNVLAGTQIGGIIGISPDLHDPQMDDPLWWAKVQDDYAHGAVTGGMVGMGVTGAKYGLDKTITPVIMDGLKAVFNPRTLIPDAAAQVAAATRANGIHQANVFADIVGLSGRKLFGKAGQGLNTAEAAAYAEQNKTLVGFVADDGSRVTPNQEQWLQVRLWYEDWAQQELSAKKILGPSQDVSTPIGDPGPSVHIFHAYDQGVADAQKEAARRGSGLGWRDSITNARAKTVDPTIDPNTPRTIREALDLYAADKLNNPKPLDDLVTRFEASAYQTEKSLTNREFYDVVRPVGKAGPGTSVAYKDVAPEGWVRPEGKWGFGHGVDDMRFEPNLANYLNNVSGVSRSAPWLEWYGEHVAAPAKSLLFSGSIVHAFNVAYRVASAMTSDQQGELFRSYIMPTLFHGGYGNLLLANQTLALDAAAHGLTGSRIAAEGIVPKLGWTGGLVRSGVAGTTGAAAGYTQAKARGETEDEARDAARFGAALGIPTALPGAGAIIKAFGKDVDVGAAASMADVLHHAIFREGLPAAKLGMYDILTRSGMDGNLAADMTNNTVGGIDQIKLGRSPWVQDLMRYGLIASDWTEGQVRTLGNTFMPNQLGAHTRTSLLQGLGKYMAYVELLNIAFNGHPTWENGDGNEYKLEVTGLQDKLANEYGLEALRSVAPVGKVPQRTFIDPMPPLRWMMETVGEGARQLAYTQGQVEQLVPGMAASGQRLTNYAGGNLGQYDLPPDLRGKLGQDFSARLGPGPSLIGAASEALHGQQYDWTGKPLDPPDFSDLPGWLTYGGHAIAPSAPASATSVLQNVDLAHDWRSHPVDALIEFLGFTRANRTTELNERLSGADRVKQDYLHVPPDISALNEENHQRDIANNDQKRVDAFNALIDPKSTITHAQHDDAMHLISVQRKDFTRKQEIIDDYASKVPAGPLRDTIQKLLENVWNVSGSPLDADLKPTTNVDELAKAYWSPPGVDVTDTKALSKARINLLNDFAETHDEDPEALQDMLKWQSQHQDDLSKATPPVPSLPGVTSGHLGELASGYLQAGEDGHGNLIQDINVRGDKMRQFLKDNAAAISQASGQTVAPETLQERINLRLAGVGQTTPIERSYNAALQTFFASKDEDRFPRYVDENGKAVGTRVDWDLWDKQINDVGASMASKLPKWRNLYLQQERGTDAREKYLISHPNNPDYERFFGVGRSMTEPEWKQYTTGKLVGYTDLVRNAAKGPPANETIRRDKIQELYRASNQQERIHTRVKIWLNGQERELPLLGAYTVARQFMRNSAGRSLESMAAHDDPDPSHPPADTSTVGANDGTQ